MTAPVTAAAMSATSPTDGPGPVAHVAGNGLGDARLELVRRVEDEARRAGRADAAERLARERAHAQTRECTVLVVGEFKKGKSSLLNALLNAPLCPVDADIATAVPTTLRYGEEVRASVRGPGEVAQIPVEEVDRHVRATAGAEQTVDIAVPRQLLADGLVLVDTPGVGGGLHSAHAAATLRALARADAVVFVSDASQEYTAAELAFLHQVRAQCPTVVCVLTKIDFYPEWQRILDLDTGHLRRAGHAGLEIVPVSAPLREAGLRTGDRALVRDSGFPRLAAFLRTAALARTADVLTAAALSSAHAVLTQVLTGVLAQRQAVADDAGSAQLLARLEEAKAQADRLRSGASRWQQVLGDRIADMVSNVDLDLARRLRRVRREAAERINSEDPTRIWPELEAWVYAETNEQVLSHYRGMREEADRVVHEVARQYGIAVGDIARRVQLPDAAGLDDVVLGPLQAEQSTWFERGMMVARGTSGGALVTHAAGVVFGLALPVTLPATAVLGAVLARKAVRGMRESELRVNRVEAVRAVNTYLEDAELLARKDSRDALRRISQGLRDHFSERAGEVHVAAAQNLESVARAVQADRETKSRRLAKLDEQAAALRALLEEIDRALPAASAGRMSKSDGDGDGDAAATARAVTTGAPT